NTISGFRARSFTDRDVLACGRCRPWRWRRRERQLDDDAQLAWPELAFHPPIELAHDCHVDKARSEAALARRIDFSSEIFPPFQPELTAIAGLLDIPGNLEAATILRERTVFQSVGGELMKDEPERQYLARRQHHARPVGLVVHVGTADDRDELRLQDL